MVVPLLLYSTQAEAHLMSTGMGPIYDGLMHFVTSPEDLLPALGLALLAGARGIAFGQRVIWALPVAWLVGCLLGMNGSAPGLGAFVNSLSLVLVGGLVAADARLSLRITTALVALLGLAHGYINGVGMGFSTTAIIASLGLISAIFVVVALVAGAVISLQARWARVAVRVIGSWIAASGLLMLGWAIRAVTR